MKAVLYLVMISLVLSVNSLDDLFEKKCELKIEVYPAGTTSPSYYFYMQDEVLTVEKIIMDYSKIFRKQTEEKEQTKLSETEKKEIIELADKVYVAEKDESFVVHDAWEIKMIYKDKVFENYYAIMDEESEHMTALTDMLIELTSVEVDLHGWA